MDKDNSQSLWDYIIIGSGPGGAPLACNLVEAGKKVLLLEAGGDKQPDDFNVPAYHPIASEDDDLKWDYFVRHYKDDALQKRDPKFVPEKDGVLYPRCGTLGGCSAHNAMITIYPHNLDWDYIAELMKDETWSSDKMRDYFERIENAEYRPIDRFLFKFFGFFGIRFNPSRHGFNKKGKGWFTSNTADPEILIKSLDLPLIDMISGAFIEALTEKVGNIKKRLRNLADPNDWRQVKANAEGINQTPLWTTNGKRGSTRDIIRQKLKTHPDLLTLKMNTLVSKIILDENKRAIGVEYLEGANLYRAGATIDPDKNAGKRGEYYARNEVVVCGGAFNTPQILMLSGIGPKEELDKHNIPVQVELPGVGKNLQDRYEVGVVHEMKKDFKILKDASFKTPDKDGVTDPVYKEWEQGKGLYTTNGAVIAIIKKSLPERPLPDLFIFGLPGYFRGYFPGYSKALQEHKNYFTWAILKAHTNNTAGVVSLRSSDPRDTPLIDFHYFEEGNDTSGQDVESVVQGIEFVRRTIKHHNQDVVKEETVPGPKYQTHEELIEFVKGHAWGHHTSCSCKMGPKEDPLAVVDSNFKVHGIEGLRIVDASVFPRIPGFFIVTSIYMISEKASDVILNDYDQTRRIISAEKEQELAGKNA